MEVHNGRFSPKALFFPPFGFKNSNVDAALTALLICLTGTRLWLSVQRWWFSGSPAAPMLCHLGSHGLFLTFPRRCPLELCSAFDLMFAPRWGSFGSDCGPLVEAGEQHVPADVWVGRRDGSAELCVCCMVLCYFLSNSWNCFYSFDFSQTL